MSPRNRIRAVVAAVGCVLIVHGALQILEARDADAAPCTVGATGAGCTKVSGPAEVSQAPLPEPALRGTGAFGPPAVAQDEPGRVLKDSDVGPVSVSGAHGDL